jgi:hypothetical protein
MADRKRVQWSTSSDPDLLAKFRQLSEDSRIPASRLLDEALELLLIQHKVMKPKAAPKKAPTKEKD